MVALTLTAENRNKVRGNDLGVKAIVLVYHKLHGMAGNRGLTGEADGAAATDGVDGVNSFQVDEGDPSPAS
jgi:hypothetical protein